MKFKKTDLDISSFQFNLTPLVDVVFQLLIFIILSSSFVMQPGIKVNLPSTVSSEAQLEKEIVISLTEEGVIYLMDSPISIIDLPKKLKGLISFSKDKILIIKADENTRHGLVVKVMDIGKIVGVEKLAIATQPKELR
ncbi:MAG: biopolymer transporter ExbD [bacterium]